MENYICECGQAFFRIANRLTECPTCHQVVVDIDGETVKVFE